MRDIRMISGPGVNADAASDGLYLVRGTRLGGTWWHRFYRYGDDLYLGPTRQVTPEDGDTLPRTLSVGQSVTVDGRAWTIGGDIESLPTLTPSGHVTKENDR